MIRSILFVLKKKQTSHIFTNKSSGLFIFAPYLLEFILNIQHNLTIILVRFFTAVKCGCGYVRFRSFCNLAHDFQISL